MVTPKCSWSGGDAYCERPARDHGGIIMCEKHYQEGLDRLMKAIGELEAEEAGDVPEHSGGSSSTKP